MKKDVILFHLRRRLKAITDDGPDPDRTAEQGVTAKERLRLSARGTEIQRLYAEEANVLTYLIDHVEKTT
jgi:hypothetical protein